MKKKSPKYQGENPMSFIELMIVAALLLLVSVCSGVGQLMITNYKMQILPPQAFNKLK